MNYFQILLGTVFLIAAIVGLGTSYPPWGSGDRRVIGASFVSIFIGILAIASA